LFRRLLFFLFLDFIRCENFIIAESLLNYWRILLDRFDRYEGLQKVFRFAVGSASLVEIAETVVVEEGFGVLGERIEVRFGPESFIDSYLFPKLLLYGLDSPSRGFHFDSAMPVFSVLFAAIFKHEHSDSFFILCINFAFL
jgi:hypothetical protein